MRFAPIALGTAAILCGAAFAGDTGGISGNVSLGYNYARIAQTNIDEVNAGGSLVYATPGGLNIQVDASYSEPKAYRQALDNYSFGGVVFYRNANYAAGVYGDRNWVSFGGGNSIYTSGGVIGEWYAGDITLRVRGGGLTSRAGDGGQYGGGASYYVMPDVSLNLDASYLNFASINRTNIVAGAEYQPWDQFPMALSAAWTYEQYKTAGYYTGGNGVMFRLTYRFGNGTSLVERDRSGALNSYKTPILSF